MNMYQCQTLALLYNEEKVVGYIDVTYCYERNEPYDLWVDNEFQDKGYEQALLQAAIKMNKPKKNDGFG